jgi:RimJ/RimL family protein N-acetyltransferase
VVTANSFGQPIGDDLGDWVPPSRLEAVVLAGSYVTLEPMIPGDGSKLFHCMKDEPGSLWTYMSMGPFSQPEAFESSLTDMMDRSDWCPYVVVVDDEIQGFLTYLRIDLAGGVIEIGSIVFGSNLQRTSAATESIYLLIKHAFESGFRRVEWKCDNLNGPSMKAAERFGFTYEGTFEQATHYKGRNRDTAWFAIVDSDWPSLASAYREWLSPGNFDQSGSQIKALAEIRQDLSTGH